MTTKKAVTKKSPQKAKIPNVSKDEKQVELDKVLKQLELAKTSNRKKTLRKQLRNLGHKGGLKSLKEKSNG